MGRGKENVKEIKQFFRIVVYGPVLLYHLRKQNGSKNLVYHYEKAKDLYRKIMKKPFE